MDLEKKRFAWGVGLAWLPIVLVIGQVFFYGFRGISQEKATGLAAVAGGFAEALTTFGLLSFVVCEVWAIVLLLRVVKREQWSRSMFAVVSIVCSVGFLLLTVLMFWWLWHVRSAFPSVLRNSHKLAVTPRSEN
ncbi:MAG: hypothetical protein DMG81_17385 [Acidobacteria bacterium]|nr:MAG: hypothetical protein DMG81_17385 [Acidobacteriota bacterium]